MHNVAPAFLGKVFIKRKTGVLGNNITSLLLKSSIKKAQIFINFETDAIKTFGYNIPLTTTSSDHYAFPLTKDHSSHRGTKFHLKKHSPTKRANSHLK